MSAGLEIRGAATGLLDDPLLLGVRGGAGDEGVLWRARYRDDDERVWRATAEHARDLAGAWGLAKPGGSTMAALQSLRPVSIDVRVELPDGRAVNRSITRRLLGEGVRVRRWREGFAANLYLPAGEQACATVVVDATAGAGQVAVATLAAALLASRGVLALVVPAPATSRGSSAAALLALAVERLAAVPRASASIEVLAALDPLAAVDRGEPRGEVVLPPGVGARDRAEGAAARALVWDRMLARLGATPREVSGGERPAAHAGTVKL